MKIIKIKVGSTGVAALKEGFSYIGIEREPLYCEITLARLIRRLEYSILDF